MKVFLSHQSGDVSIVREVGAALEPYGTTLWLDERELRAGAKLSAEIDAAISASDRVLVFVSARSMKSGWVMRELDAFLDKETRLQQAIVIPVVIEEVPLPKSIEDRFFVRFTPGAGAAAVRELLRGIFRDREFLLMGTRPGEFQTLDVRADVFQRHRDACREGRCAIVYDHSAVSVTVAQALSDTNAEGADELRLAWIRSFEFLAGASARLLQAVFEVYRGTVAAYEASARLLGRVWKLVVLSHLHYVRQLISPAALDALPDDVKASYRDLDAVEHGADARLRPHEQVGILTEAWLADIDARVDDCYDLGLQGATRVGAPRINDVSHLYVSKDLLSSVDLMPGSQPASAILGTTWVESMLPFVAARRAIDFGYIDSTVGESIPRLGVLPSDYCRIGVE
jgi:hypothetical protein